MRTVIATGVVALCLPSAAFAQSLTDVEVPVAGVAWDALPGVGYVRAAGTFPIGLAVAASTGYGYTEEVLGDNDSHHRALGHVAASYRPTPWLGLSGQIMARFDRHSTDTGGTDSGWLMEPRLAARASVPLSADLSLGAHLGVWFPSAKAASIDVVAIGSYVPRATPLSTHVNLGFRVDRSASSLDDPMLVSRADRVSINVADANAILLGIGWEWRLPAATILAEWSWDYLVGDDSPEPFQSPMRVGAGARFALGDQLSLDALLETAMSQTPPVGGAAPFVPIDPLVQLTFGLSYHPPAPTASVERPIVHTAPVAPPAPTTASVRGYVRDARGNAVAGALVQVGDASATTQPNGKFVIPDIAPGSLSVTVTADGFNNDSRVFNDVEAGETLRVDFEIARVELPAGQMRGTIQSFDGKPLPATIVVNPGNVSVTADAQGVFVVDLPPGEYEVTVSHPGFQPQTRPASVQEMGVTILNLDLRPQ